MTRCMKLLCLLLYGFALAAWIGVWAGGSALATQTVATVILTVHAFEALVALKYVRRYRGSLVISIVLTLLFGLLHVMPLIREARRAE